MMDFFLRNFYSWAAMAGIVCAVSGCADIHARTMQETIAHPFGDGIPFARGTTKAEVQASWGVADQVISRGKDELGTPKEEWLYTGRLPGTPVDYGYVSKTKHLFFEGENLVRWASEESVPKSRGRK